MPKHQRLFVTAAAVLLWVSGLLPGASGPAHAQIFSGPAQAADGDSLAMTGLRVRLHGVDAPESAQTCQRGAEIWACGQDAKAMLARLVGGKDVRCQQRDRDKYGRVVATCHAGGLDLAHSMVAAGMAVALPEFSTDYVEHEARARGRKLGLWSSVFDMPAAWRAAHPRQEAVARIAKPEPAARDARRRPPPNVAAPRGSCAIKGNHSRRGEWIYHLPGMPYYDQTRPEAMFCTEAQARAAGYRRANVRP